MNKRSMLLACLGLAAAVVVVPASASARSAVRTQACAVIDDKAVEELFNTWNAALKDNTSARIVALYANDATLLPTLSNGPYEKGHGLENYFDDFIKKEPVAMIEESTRTIKLGCNVAYDIGLYDFTFKAPDKPAKARYTFIYKYDARAKRWLIAHHHSSLQPQQ
jgi:uncharacterized protein (TIGR02246 family)